jgi:acyl carrier protein
MSVIALSLTRFDTISDHFKAIEIDPSHVVPEAHLVEDLGADSLDIVETVFAVEDQFGHEIGEEETEGLVTVADLIADAAFPDSLIISQITSSPPGFAGRPLLSLGPTA